MLHKKFKPSKCKTALNLAKSRIKLLKNKKEIQVKQLRRELAQLLESGKDQTARIRVEHVVREEKTMAAFELIEIYCELIVARLPIVESQKNCPLDLKEAIASLIFAAPRCGDIPELEDIRKHFTTKYGKEFVVAATELRPDCGVSRNLVEKLSAKAPDGSTKVKILTAIAEEHNIKWEPRWFEDESPAPSIEVRHIEKAGMIQMEPLNFEIADNLQHSTAYGATRSNTSSQSHPHANSDVSEVQPSSSRPDEKPGRYSDRMDFSHSSGTAENAVEAGRQKWKMEFKDAAAAAQAAADSAERASMAARAAAELSRHSNFLSEASLRPLGSPGHGWNEDRKVYAGSVLKDKHVDEDPANASYNQETQRMQVDQVGAYGQGNVTKGTKARTLEQESGVQYESKGEESRASKNNFYPVYQEVTQSMDCTPTPSASEAEYDVFESPEHQEYRNVLVDKSFHEEPVNMKYEPSSFESQTSSFEDEDGVFSNYDDRNKNNYSDDGYYGSSNQGTANDDDWHVKTPYHSGFNDDKVDPIFTDAGEGDRISVSVAQKNGFDSSEDIFVSMDHKTNEMDDTEEIGTHTDTHAVFDDSGSDDDECIFDPAGKSYDPSSPRESAPKHFPSHQESYSSFYSHAHHGLDVSESFRESPLFAKLSEPLPVKFDSDGESLGSERELQNKKTLGVILSNDDVKHDTNLDVSSKNGESQSIYSDVASKQKSETEDLYNHQPSSSRLTSQSSDPVSGLENETQASSENGMELNFEWLPGGRRNKRLWDPPYRRGTVGDASSSPRFSVAGADGGLDFQVPSSEVATSQISKRSGVYTHFDSIGDNPEVVSTQKGPNNAERQYSPTIDETAHRTWNDPTGYFYSSDRSSDDDTPKQPTNSRTLPGAGLSRRTKGSAARSVTGSQPSSSAEDSQDSNSYATEVSPKCQTETAATRSRHTSNSRWDEALPSRPRLQKKVSEDVYSSSSSAVEKQKTPNDTETLRASKSNEKPPSRENSTKKSGHVHPKLPDFETLTAQLQALRTNRQQ